MYDAQIDVMALTETWLYDTIADHEVFPTSSGVSLIRADRNCHGGGVAFAVSDHFHFCVRPDLREGNVESL